MEAKYYGIDESILKMQGYCTDALESIVDINRLTGGLSDILFKERKLLPIIDCCMRDEGLAGELKQRRQEMAVITLEAALLIREVQKKLNATINNIDAFNAYFDSTEK